MAWSVVTNPGNKARAPKKIDITNYNSASVVAQSVNMLMPLYKGRQDRFERYRYYDWMDSDSDVSRALDLISEHCTEKDKDGLMFRFIWSNSETTEELSGLLKEVLKQWSGKNEWKKRLWRGVRNVLKYGDWFYFRDPKTFELYNIHPKHVTGAFIDKETNEIKAWQVKNFTFSASNLEVFVDVPRYVVDNLQYMDRSNNNNTKIIPAEHILHLSLSEGRFAGATTDDESGDKNFNRWPFSESWLEQIYKTFKQRELLEDANIINRVQRAPLRLVWYVDISRVRPDKGNFILNDFKTEINQKRVPNFIGSDGENIRTVDSVYNAIGQIEDYYLPVGVNGKGTKVETIDGNPWDGTPDLDFFLKKLLRALRVPYEWLVGPSNGGIVFNDNKVGVAYQEEIEFGRFCLRVQHLIEDIFDREFKLFCRAKDINVNISDFSIAFNSPDNYEDSRRFAKLQDNVNLYTQLKDEKYFSRRFMLEKLLGLTPDEIVQNEKMYFEEHGLITYNNENEQSKISGGGDIGGFGGGGGELNLPSDGIADENPEDLNFADAGVVGNDQQSLGGEPNQSPATSAPGGGFGETVMKRNHNILLEDGEFDNITPSEQKDEYFYDVKIPNDKTFLTNSPIKGKATITLGLLQKIRRAEFAKSVNQIKRVKSYKIIYAQQQDSNF